MPADLVAALAEFKARIATVRETYWPAGGPDVVNGEWCDLGDRVIAYVEAAGRTDETVAVANQWAATCPPLVGNAYAGWDKVARRTRSAQIARRLAGIFGEPVDENPASPLAFEALFSEYEATAAAARSRWPVDLDEQRQIRQTWHHLGDLVAGYAESVGATEDALRIASRWAWLRPEPLRNERDLPKDFPDTVPGMALSERFVRGFGQAFFTGDNSPAPSFGGDAPLTPAGDKMAGDKTAAVIDAALTGVEAARAAISDTDLAGQRRLRLAWQGAGRLIADYTATSTDLDTVRALGERWTAVRPETLPNEHELPDDFPSNLPDQSLIDRIARAFDLPPRCSATGWPAASE